MSFSWPAAYVLHFTLFQFISFADTQRYLMKQQNFKHSEFPTMIWVSLAAAVRMWPSRESADGFPHKSEALPRICFSLLISRATQRRE